MIMKRLMIVAVLFLAGVALMAQETVCVCFTASTESGDYYCPFTSINVTNVTRGWSETLVYPDTLLVLTNTDGIDELEDSSFHLGEAFPNPFSGCAEALLRMPESGDLLLRVVRLDGKEVCARKMRLDAGSHRLIVHLSSPGAALLSVSTAWGWQVVKLVQVGAGEKDLIEVGDVTYSMLSDGQSKRFRGSGVGDFEPGDLMSYEALLETEEVTVQSEIVTQPQYNDETVTFRFPLERPSDIGTIIDYVSITEVKCEGYTIEDSDPTDVDPGILERGHCWSTNPNPTINDDHATAYYYNYYNFLTSITGLQADTKYYLRSYVTNLVGTVYGDQLEFTTFIDGGPDVEGTIDGLFTVAEGRSVYFSSGNLMYNKTTHEWSFMANQYDIVETSGQDVGFEYLNQDTIALFGWATSGWDNGNEFYQPYSTKYSCHIVSFNCCDKGWGYGPIQGLYAASFINLVPPYADADWGFYNAITNGGNTPRMWRALTGEEWYYLVNTRATPSGIRYAKAVVNDVNGLLLLPDDWDAAIYALNAVNTSDADFTSNELTTEVWAVLEANGAVFLPAAGLRWGSQSISSPTISDVGFWGYYWSSHAEGGCYAKALRFSDSLLGLTEESDRYLGLSVRLVRPAF